MLRPHGVVTQRITPTFKIMIRMIIIQSMHSGMQ